MSLMKLRLFVPLLAAALLAGCAAPEASKPSEPAPGQPAADRPSAAKAQDMQRLLGAYKGSHAGTDYEMQLKEDGALVWKETKGGETTEKSGRWRHEAETVGSELLLLIQDKGGKSLTAVMSDQKGSFETDNVEGVTFKEGEVLTLKKQ